MAASLVGFITGYTGAFNQPLNYAAADRHGLCRPAGYLPPPGMMLVALPRPRCAVVLRWAPCYGFNLIPLALATIASCLTVDLLPLLLPRFLTGIASG